VGGARSGDGRKWEGGRVSGVQLLVGGCEGRRSEGGRGRGKSRGGEEERGVVYVVWCG